MKPYLLALPFSKRTEKLVNFRHFVTFPTASIKISWIVHKNIWVYCVEFPCAKKQSFLLLEVWCTSFSFYLFFFGGELRRFIPLASFNSLWLVQSELTTKKKNKTPASIKAQSSTWCKVNLEDSANLLFICKWGELSSDFFLGNPFRHPRLEPIPAFPGNMCFQQRPGRNIMSLDYFSIAKVKAKQ